MITRRIRNRSWFIQYVRVSDGSILSAEDLKGFRAEPTRVDVDNHLENGLFALRRPGVYRPVCSICAIPPQSVWEITSSSYRFIADLRSSRSSAVEFSDLFSYADRLLRRCPVDKHVGVELSGGLDSSIVVEYLLRRSCPVSLIGFVSNRWEFRTERKIQEYFANRCQSKQLISYEECTAFGSLDEVPPHPFPAQESLFFGRHRAAAEAAQSMGLRILLSGEAGDQLLGFTPELCDKDGRAPIGYAYWNLAEQWSDQHVYRPRGVRYVSALAVGRFPALWLKVRVGQGSDHMKLWVRRNLRGFLPEMLSEYAYKAFHDGWVIDGLKAASGTIFRVSELAFKLTRHPELNPNELVNEANNFRHLNEVQRARFLSKLSFSVWLFSNNRDKR